MTPASLQCAIRRKRRLAGRGCLGHMQKKERWVCEEIVNLVGGGRGCALVRSFGGRSDPRGGRDWRQRRGRPDRRHRLVQGHSVCGRAAWASALEGTAAREAVDWSEGGVHIRGKLHAGPELCENLCRASCHWRGLPVSQRVDSGKVSRRPAARDGVDLRRRFYWRYDQRAGL